MSKVLYTDFEPVDDLLSTYMSNPNFKKAIAKTNLYNFWDGILPEKYKNMSKPFGMMPGKIMIIACKNPIVAQELTLRKTSKSNRPEKAGAYERYQETIFRGKKILE